MELQVAPWMGEDSLAGGTRDVIFVRDSQRERLLITGDYATRFILLAALSSDPRSFDELSLAWARYRPETELSDHPWQSLIEWPPKNANWLWLDRTRQVFAWHDHLPDHGGLSAIHLPYSGCCELEVEVDGEAQVERVWMNVPPWWTYMQSSSWSDLMSHRYPLKQCLDYRDILYGNSLRDFIASRVDAIAPKQLLEAIDEQQLSMALVRQIHSEWLMTPRPELNSLSPRYYLHADRSWKEQELANRRAQWSHERRPPPLVPQDSHQYRYGPMATEEIICYFEYCRYSINVALRHRVENVQLAVPEASVFLKGCQAEWFHQPLDRLGGVTPWELIDAERALLPRVVSVDLIDRSCPLCRLQMLDDELFGPTFHVSDGYWLEREGDFAFSLIDQQNLWEAEQVKRKIDLETSQPLDHVCLGSHPMPDQSHKPNDHFATRRFSVDDRPANLYAVDSQKRSNEDNRVAVWADDDDHWPKLWHTSFIDDTQEEPRLSLLLIGARLSELMENLRYTGGLESEIDQLNAAFDRLIEAVKAWLVAEVMGTKMAKQNPTAKAVESMINELEHVATHYPELTARSADLQSLVHHWQRLLVTGENAN